MDIFLLILGFFLVMLSIFSGVVAIGWIGMGITGLSYLFYSFLDKKVEANYVE